MTLKEIRNNQTAGIQPVDGVLQNARNFPRQFYVRHMQPGVVGYNNENILVDADAIKKMLPSFVGRPVYMNHRDVDLENIKNDAVGYVTEGFWNPEDSWAWAKVILIDDEAVHAAESGGWSVSNAYIPQDWAGGGMCNNIGYDRAITTGTFTHLALVEDPRYELAKIFTPEQFHSYQDEKRQQYNALKNSKNEPKKGKAMFKLFASKREEVSTVEAATHAEFTNAKGETVSVSMEDMVKAVENSTKQAEAKAQTVLVNGKEMLVTDVVKAFEALQNGKSEVMDEAKENATDEEIAKATGKENAAKEEDKKDEEKENSKSETDHFKELSNANKKTESVTVIDTPANRLQRGQALYGSAQ